MRSASTPTEQGWMARLWPYLWRHRKGVVLAIGASLLGSAAQTVTPLIARHILDKVIVARTSPLWPWLLILIAAAVLTFLFTYTRRYRGGEVALQVQADLRDAMRDHLLTLDQHSLGKLPTGQLVAR